MRSRIDARNLGSSGVGLSTETQFEDPTCHRVPRRTFVPGGASSSAAWAERVKTKVAAFLWVLDEQRRKEEDSDDDEVVCFFCKSPNHSASSCPTLRTDDDSEKEIFI